MFCNITYHDTCTYIGVRNNDKMLQDIYREITMLSNKVVFTGTSSWLWETETRHCYLRISCSWISSEVRQCHSTNSTGYIYIFFVNSKQIYFQLNHSTFALYCDMYSMLMFLQGWMQVPVGHKCSLAGSGWSRHSPVQVKIRQSDIIKLSDFSFILYSKHLLTPDL